MSVFFNYLSRDERFRALPEQERQKVLDALDALPDDKKQAAIGALKTRGAPAPKGDPGAHEEGFLEEAFPAAAHPADYASGLLETMNPGPLLNDVGSTVADTMAGKPRIPEFVQSDLRQRKEAFQRVQERTPKDNYDASQQVRDLFEAIVPFLGPAMANAGRRMESPWATERAKGFGNAIGVTAGPELMKQGVMPAVADAMEAGNLRQYKGAINTPASKAGLRDQVAPELLDRGVRFSNAEDLFRQGEEGAQSVDPGAEAAKTKPLLPVDTMIKRIDKAINARYNTVWDPKKNQGTMVYKDPSVPMATYRGNQLPADVAAMREFQDTLKDHAPSGYIDTKQAIALRNEWNRIAGNRGYFDDAGGVNDRSVQLSPTDQAKVNSAKAVGDTVNDIPGVKPLNEEKSFWLDVKRWARGSKETATVDNIKSAIGRYAVRGVVGGAVGSAAGSYFGAGKIGGLAGTMLAEAMDSPWWRTLAATKKQAFVRYVQTGKLNSAADLAIRATQPENTEGDQ